MEAAVAARTENADGPSTEPKRLPRLGSAVVVVDEDRVLLGLRNKEPNRGRWILPGGKVEPFESIGDAAKREIREETGLDIAVERTLGVWEIIDPPAEHRVIVYSLARVTGGSLRSASDLLEARFHPLAGIDDLDLTETVRAVLAEVTASL
jgi:8-oxo-dGTP diphosphatase